MSTIDATEAEVTQRQELLVITNSSFEEVLDQIKDMVVRIQGVAQSSGTMDLTSQGLAAAAQEQAASMTQVASMVETVAAMVAQLKEVISRFRI